MLRVAKGSLVPADAWAEKMLRSRHYRVGDVVAAEIRKPRNPGFHRLAHAFGELLAQNVEALRGCDGHEALKRVQIEADIECRHARLRIDGEEVEYRMPRSLSFESMSQAEFEKFCDRVGQYVADTYWPTLSPEQVQQMIECMPAEVA